LGTARSRHGEARESPGPKPGATLHTLHTVRRFIAAALLIPTLAVLAPVIALAAPPTASQLPAAPRLAVPRADRAERPVRHLLPPPPAPPAPAITAAASSSSTPPAATSRPVRHRTATAAASTRAPRPPRPRHAETTVEPQLPPLDAGAAAAVIAFARAQLGKPYVYAAAGPGGYDCSGLVLAAYRTIGVRLPHKASAFFRVGRAVPVSQIQPGDILVMEGGGHAAIALGGGWMIHAPHAGDHVRVARIYQTPNAVRRLIG